jgi:O-antigen ligase
MLSTLTRYSIYSLLIFTPLAIGAVQGWAISVIHLITLLALTAFLLEKSLIGDWRWIKTPLDKPILCTLILCLLSSVFSVHKYSSIWAFILLLNYVIIFYLIVHTINTRNHLRELVYVIIFVAAFLSMFGLVKKFGCNPFPWWEYDIGLNKELAASSSTFGNPNHFAGYLAMTIPLLLGFFFTGFRSDKFFLLTILTLLMAMAIIHSLSRGGWTSAFVGLTFMFSVLLANQYVGHKTISLIIIAGVFFWAFIVLANRPLVEEILTIKQASQDASIQSRVLVWRKTVDMIRDHPILGTGPGTYSMMFTRYQPPGFTSRYFMAHNDYLHFISEVGIPIIVVMVWMIIRFYHRGITKLANPSRLIRNTTLGAMSGVTALLVYSIFDFNLHIPANAILFTVLAAIVVAPIPLAEDRGQMSEDRRQRTDVRGQITDNQ